MNYKIVKLDEVASTQDHARKIARPGVVVLARKMNAGRGRNGHSWLAEPGGLWTTIILPLKFSSLLSLAAGVAVSRTFERFGIKTCLKWPNDVLVAGKKIAGVLGEVHDNLIYLGIGVNLNNEISKHLPTAISASELGLKISPDEFLFPLLAHLDCILLRGRIIKEWKEWECTLNRRILVIESGKSYEAFAEDLDGEGFLVVKVGNERRRIVAGDIVIQTEGALRRREADK